VSLCLPLRPAKSRHVGALYPLTIPTTSLDLRLAQSRAYTMSQHARATTFDDHKLWWTTSGTETFLTSGTATFATSGGLTFLSSPTPTSAGGTDSFPASSSVATSANSAGLSSSPDPSGYPSSVSSSFPFRPSVTSSHTSATSTPDPTPVIAAQAGPVCIGEGIDASGGGILATLLVPTVIGLIIWASVDYYSG
jgi:hypothetical protein